MISVKGSLGSDKDGDSGRLSNELEHIPNLIGNHYGSSLLPWAQRLRTQNILGVTYQGFLAASGHIKLHT